jgi:hypothetical protein
MTEKSLHMDHDARYVLTLREGVPKSRQSPHHIMTFERSRESIRPTVRSTDLPLSSSAARRERFANGVRYDEQALGWGRRPGEHGGSRISATRTR